jgi:Asp-tRNA(Asn)/Glu-tRNA(Gln) amidotransferase A subunit family amidase
MEAKMPDKEIHELTIKQTAAALAAKKFSVAELVNHYLERIAKYDGEIMAWALVDEDGALKAARRLDRELRQGKSRGVLHGIPIGVKDLMYTAGLRTEGGSKVFEGFIPEYDAAAVAKLREAGAIILGKTTTTSLGFFDPAPTRNPWNTAHTPGGSSSGSGAAVAARMCPAALGSQVGGSILRPAAFNGVVGFKPQIGRVSSYGSLASNWTMAHVGVITRSVEDTAVVFQEMAGFDPNDPISFDEPVPNCLTHLQSQRKPPRIGLVEKQFFEFADEEMRQETLEAAERFAGSGAIVEEVTLPASFANVQEIHPIISCVEAAVSHKENFSKFKAKYTPKISQTIEKGLAMPATEYARALYSRSQQMRDINPILAKYDILLTPATPGAAPRDLTTSGSPVMQIPWSMVGIPAINLPTGLNKGGMPLGIQLAGAAFAEDRLLRVARWCEKVLNVHLEPPLA